MRIPLLLAGTPIKIDRCARVKLGMGNWKVECEGLLDSTFQFLLNEKIYLDSNSIEGPTTVEICFSNKGKETNLSIYAKCQN